MWALVLIPMWLRRHDEAQESRSAERFARAMSSLRRGQSGSSGRSSRREFAMPGRAAADQAPQVMVTGPRATSPTPSISAVRRRRVLVSLGALLAVVAAAVLLNIVPRWTLGAPVLLMTVFLVVARRQVTLAAETSRRRDRRATLSDAARAADAKYGLNESRARRGGRVLDPMSASSGAVAADRPLARDLEASARDKSAGGGAWHAVSTTLPTYVTAPRATSVPRKIDLRTPGSWNGAAMVEQARVTRAVEAADDGAMRVETFEIAVPRDPAVRAGVLAEPGPAARRVSRNGSDEDSAALAHEDEVAALLDDPRTGVHGPTWRRAANG